MGYNGIIDPSLSFALRSTEIMDQSLGSMHMSTTYQPPSSLLSPYQFSVHRGRRRTLALSSPIHTLIYLFIYLFIYLADLCGFQYTIGWLFHSVIQCRAAVKLHENTVHIIQYNTVTTNFVIQHWIKDILKRHCTVC